jgi:hypothetical protein
MRDINADEWWEEGDVYEEDYYQPVNKNLTNKYIERLKHLIDDVYVDLPIIRGLYNSIEEMDGVVLDGIRVGSDDFSVLVEMVTPEGFNPSDPDIIRYKDCFISYDPAQPNGSIVLIVRKS